MLAVAGNARLEGLVTDETGAPIAGADIGLVGNPTRFTTTEQDGSFFFEGLAPGDVVVTASHGENVAVGRATLASDGAFILLTLRNGAELVVVVTDGQGPIAGAEVATSLPLVKPQPTDANGETRLQGLPEGYIGLSVSAKGYAATHTGRTIASGKQSKTILLRSSIEASGIVVDQNGQPVANANIYMNTLDVGGWIDQWRPADAISNADGTFSLPLATQSDHRLIAKKDGYAPSQSSIVSSAVAPISSIKLVLDAGRRITGAVVNGQSVPIANATVTAWIGLNRQRTLTDSKGAFVLTGLPPTSAGVRAGGERGVSEFIKVDLTGQDAQLSITLDEGLTIAGHVRGEGPLEGIGLVAFPMSAVTGFLRSSGRLDDMVTGEVLSSLLTATTDADGRFVFAGAAKGDYEIRLREAVSAVDSVKAQAGDQDVEIKLSSTARVTAKVSLPDGSPVDGTFKLGTARGREFTGGIVDMPNVPTGNVAIQIYGDSFKKESRNDVVIEEGTNDLGIITVQPGRLVSGRVVNGKGIAVAGAGVAFYNPADAATSRTRTAADGTFQIRTNQTHQTSIFAATDQAVSKGASVPEGEGDVTGLELVVSTSGNVRGTLTKAGKPLGNAPLLFVLEGESSNPLARITTGTDGQFVVRNLPAGKYVALLSVGGEMDGMIGGMLQEVGVFKISPNAWVSVVFEAKD